MHQNLTGDQSVSFVVDFRGRQHHGLNITWLHNGSALSSTDPRSINNTFTSGTGRTELSIPTAMRAYAGLYRVLITSQVGAEGQAPVYSSQDEASFQLDVTGKACLFFSCSEEEMMS